MPSTADTFENPARSRPRDLLVAGGGIAGLALAAAVRQACPGASVTLCDPAAEGNHGGSRSLRAVAVAPDARRFLDRLGVWAGLVAAAQPVLSMEITDSRPEDLPRPVYLGFANDADPGEPLAHMVFHDEARAALLDRCAALGVEILPHRVLAVDEGGSLAVATLSDRSALRTRLVVAADGGRSRLREAARIGTVGWDYGQAGIVATVAHGLAHHGRAVQHFLPGGPLAILPLRADDGTEHRFSLVWTAGSAEAERLVALSPDAFIEALESVVGYEFGALRLEDRPRALPLRLMLARRLVAGRLALLGDAARTVHPLAGQGLNLGLRDAETLAGLLAGRVALGLDIGDPATLESYERARRFDGVVMALATDGLNRLFSNDSLPVRLLRDLGLGLVDRMPMLKERFVNEAAGGSRATLIPR